MHTYRHDRRFAGRNGVGLVPVGLATLALAACGDDDAASGADGRDASSDVAGETLDPSDDPVAGTLVNLGVDLAATPRVDDRDQPLPADYAPLGSARTLAKKGELFLAGLPVGGDGERVALLKFAPGVSNVPGVADVPDAMRALPEGPLDAAWKESTHNDAAACDLDGDGREEVAQLWWSSADDALRIAVVDDAVAGFARSTSNVIDTAAQVSWLEAACGDLDGDGDDDLVVALVLGAAASVRVDFAEGSSDDGFRVDETRRKTFAATQTSSRQGIELALGQLDRDAGLELAVVVNEVWGSGADAAPGQGRADYFIYDDGRADLAQLAAGRVSAEVDARTRDGLTASLALGDVDGDGLAEVVFGALTGEFPIRCDPIETLQLALDDGAHAFARLGASVAITPRNDEGTGCESSGNNGHIEHVWVDTLDIDGDQLAEIHVSGRVFDDFVNAARPFDPLLLDMGGDDPLPARIPNAFLYKSGGGNNQWAQVTRANTALAVGDVTADGKDDIVVYASGPVPVGRRVSGSSSSLVYAHAVTVWGIDPLTGRWGKALPDDAHVGLLHLVELTGSAASTGTGGPPLVVPVDVDEDSTAIRFEAGSHRIVFSEPLVHAALAAPPCHDDGSQTSDDCRTSWGTGATTGVSASLAHEISVKHHTGVTGGVSLPLIGDVGVEVEESVGLSLRAEASLGYELTRTITYTTGPMEDTVIATVVPYDQYTYKVLSHPLYPELVGKDMVISLPRAPRTMQISRPFYNEAIVGDGVRIGADVFAHTIGDPASYPTRAQMSATSGATRIGPQDVGASGGSQTVTLSESVVAGFTTTIGLSYETSVKATAGAVMEGYSVSSTTEASLGFTVGSEVTFSGTVGDMLPEHFNLDKAYSFGMFVYKLGVADSDRTIQVVNYWVE